MTESVSEASTAGRERYAPLLNRLRDMPEDVPVTATPSHLIERAFLEIFQQTDAEHRRRAIDELFAPDILFVDPEHESHGVPDVIAQIAALIDGLDPSWTFRSVASAVQIADVAIHRWELGPEGTAIVSGTDVIFAADGKIARFYTLVG